MKKSLITIFVCILLLGIFVQTAYAVGGWSNVLVVHPHELVWFKRYTFSEVGPCSIYKVSFEFEYEYLNKWIGYLWQFDILDGVWEQNDTYVFDAVGSIRTETAGWPRVELMSYSVPPWGGSLWKISSTNQYKALTPSYCTNFYRVYQPLNIKPPDDDLPGGGTPYPEP